MSEVLVIGHRNPDTDAICSAIGYAEFKRSTGMASAVAARCAAITRGGIAAEAATGAGPAGAAGVRRSRAASTARLRKQVGRVARPTARHHQERSHE